MNCFAIPVSLLLLLASTSLAMGDDEVLFYVHNKTSTPVYATLWEGKGIYVNDQEIQPGRAESFYSQTRGACFRKGYQGFSSIDHSAKRANPAG